MRGLLIREKMPDHKLHSPSCMIDKIYELSMFLQTCGWLRVTFVIILPRLVIIMILVPAIFDSFNRWQDDSFIGDTGTHHIYLPGTRS
uniref:Uncharacterized protein n=1 Tax=Arundo donax TaxID=35708 RepID=A0A0A9G1A0_ARUDO